MYLDPKKDEEDMYNLAVIYKKMADWINITNKQAGYGVNPGYLEWYDNHKRGK